MKKILLSFMVFFLLFILPRLTFAQVPPNSWECVAVGRVPACIPNTANDTCTGTNVIPPSADSVCSFYNGNASGCNNAGGTCVSPTPTPTTAPTCLAQGGTCFPVSGCAESVGNIGDYGCTPAASGQPRICCTLTNAQAGEVADPTCAGGSGIDTAIGCIPFGDSNALIGFFLKWAIGIGGGIAFILILVAGFQIMTSQGDPQRLQAGKELLTSAIAGLVLIIFSVFILEVIGVDILGIPGFGS